MIARFVLLLLCAWAAAARADSLAVVPPLAPGPFAVGCSNLAQDFTRVRSAETAQVYWEGTPESNGHARYITDLLSDPGHALAVDVTLPNDSELFGDFAGKDLSTVLLVCYPTSNQNARPAYAVPGGHAIPHMQTGAETALFADANTRYPVLLFSVGLAGSPISDETIDAL